MSRYGVLYMTLDLKRIFATENSVLPINCSIDMSDLEFAGGFPLKKPVDVSGTVSNSAGVVSLLLTINYEFSAPCDRCGTDAVNKHTVVIDKLLADALERQESDTIIEVPGMKLDVDGLVYAEVVLNLPTKHLCRTDCKGICPHCGKNLNDGACGCSDNEIDPRLAALKDLLEN